MQNASGSEIETIVRLVTERVRALCASPPADANSATSAFASQANPGSAGTLRLDRRLVTLEDLRGQLESLKTLQVDLQAVVTPAVQDELRDRGIVLQRLANESNGSRTCPLAKLLLIAPPARARALAEPLQSLGVRLEFSASGEALASIIKHFENVGSTCVWCSARPYAELWAAVRIASIAAVQLWRADDLPRAMEQAKPNLLILDDHHWSSQAIVGLAKAYARSCAQ